MCQFYRSEQDLLDVLVPYFKAGLEANECCMWVTSAPLTEAGAVHALRQAVPELDTYLARGQMVFVTHDEWYLLGGEFDAGRILEAWGEQLQWAKRRGFSGLRLTGNTFWLEERHWRDFVTYEAEVEKVFSKAEMIALCTYSLDRCRSEEIIEVVNNHQYSLVKRDGNWEAIENTVKRLVREELTETIASYHDLFQYMIDGFAYHEVITDSEGRPVDYRFLEVNQAFERHTGLQRESLLGKRVTEVLPGIETDPADWIGTYGRVALSGNALRFEQFAEPLGRWYSVMAYSPKRGHFATVFEDITERKRAEEEIRTLNRSLDRHVNELKAANRELESFAYSVSHDLIAPLRSINGFSGILLEEYGELLDREGRHALQRMSASSSHMAQLIDALLELSRLTRAELKRGRVNLSATAWQIARELKGREPERRVEFSIEENLFVFADARMLRSLLENLIGNAWKFTRDRSCARIELFKEPQMEPATFCLRDNGAGFDMAHARGLFNAFHRLHDSREFPGLGIGLATAQRIVQRHGGEVWAEAAPDRGASFWFTL